MEAAHDSASRIMLNAIFCAAATAQPTNVACVVPLLKSPESAPPIPGSTEHSRHHPGRHQSPQPPQA
eukprot:8961359-Pyramimonas_sp.AAC.1